MWKCLKCNAVNEGKFCHGCGEPKPLSDDNISKTAGDATHTEAPLQNKFENTVKPNYKNKNNNLLVLCIVLVVALIITVIFAAVILIGEKKPNNDEPKKIKTEDTDRRYNEKSNNEEDSMEEVEDEVDSEAEQEEEATLETAANETAGTYGMYENTYYNFHCAYPNDFNSVEPSGTNVVKCFESKDGTAVMKIRACKNSEGIGAKAAMEEYYNSHDGQVTYKANGDEWYAVSMEDYNRGYYRKCFVKKDNIYCMDFEFNMEDIDIYSPYIEYIEDNFAHN